jgi:hypothetical protein
MLKLVTGTQFHSAVFPAITYTITDVSDHWVSLSWVADGEAKTTDYYKPQAQGFVCDGSWLEGKGSDRMMIKITDDYKFTMGNTKDSKAYLERLEAVSGQWLEVDTKYLHNNQYTTMCGLHIMDRIVTEIKNDKRIGPKWEGKNKPQFIVWGGVRPSSHCFWRDLLPDDQRPDVNTLFTYQHTWGRGMCTQIADEQTLNFCIVMVYFMI